MENETPVPPAEVTHEETGDQRRTAIQDFLKGKKGNLTARVEKIPDGGTLPLLLGQIDQLAQFGDAECSVRELHRIKKAVKDWIQRAFHKNITVTIKRKLPEQVVIVSDEEAAQAMLSDSASMPAMDSVVSDVDLVGGNGAATSPKKPEPAQKNGKPASSADAADAAVAAIAKIKQNKKKT